jgi:peroxiredoxin
MNLIRSIFVSAYSGFVWLLAIYAIVQITRGAEPAPAWFGLALAAAAPALFFAWLYLAGKARTSRHPVAVSVLSGLGLAITMTMNWRFPASSAIHVWAGLCLLGWFVYLKWYSNFGLRQAPGLKIGSSLPDFGLETLHGEALRSGAFTGNPHVLLFYRGNWCPLCSAQAAELAESYRDLKALKATVVLISSQPQAHSRRLAERFDAPMLFLHDPANRAARKLGIEARWGTPMGLQLLGYDSDTAMPTVIITDAAGRIVFVDETDNYRLRPEPGTFIAVLKSLETQS